ncbi:MAG: cation transporter [Myxococcales bacterium]|nr:cation transporter [Myxococcales bacterium]
MPEHHALHHRAAAGGRRAFGLSVALNVAFVIVEIIFGVLAGSVALLADAAHNVGDVLGLLFAWLAERLAQRRPSRRRTYGLAKATVLAALANAVLILVAVGGVAWEAIVRLAAPPPVDGPVITLVAAIGVGINTASALLFRRSAGSDANRRGAYLHLLADAAVSASVVVVGALVWVTGWRILDPLISLGIGGVILWTAWGLLREAFDLATDAAPAHIDVDAVRATLEAAPGVHAVHELHIWAMSTTEVALTAHLQMDPRAWSLALLKEIEELLRSRHGIEHITLQPEPERDGQGDAAG